MGLCTGGSDLSPHWAGDGALKELWGPIWDGETAGCWPRSREEPRAERSRDVPLLGQLEVRGVPRVLQLLPLSST